MIVGVVYKNEKTGKYGGRAYSYYCEVEDVKEGDLMVAPVKDGERTVQIVEVDVDPAKVAGIQLKTITKRADDTNNIVANDNDIDANDNNIVVNEGDIVEKGIIDIELPEPGQKEALSIENAILLKQLPIIEDRVRELGEKVRQRVETATSLVCTEDTYKEIKKERAEMNKEFAAMEEQRKAVKKAILAPYERFDETYKEYVAKPYQDADKQLGEKIREVENDLKHTKEKEVKDYYAEYLTSKGLDFPDFTATRIKITMTDSVKKLKGQAKEFIDFIAKDVDAIRSMEHADEILVEYKQDFILASAIARVTARHKAIEAEQAAEAERKARVQAQQEVAAKVQQEAGIVAETQQENVASQATLEAPVEQPAEINLRRAERKPKDEAFALSFRVVGTMEQLKALKRFLEEGGYEYEQL